MIQQRFRKDYPGEFVIIESIWRDGKKEQVREWVDNPIENQHISGRAACIGTDVDRNLFDYSRLERHKGGLLGKKRLQTYITGTIYKDIKANFCVETKNEKLAEIISTGYQVDNIVYTTASNCIRNAGEFYLIPFNPRIDIMALPLYLAAFDGHEEVFMLGYNDRSTSDTKNWQDHVNMVIRTYPAVKFYFVNIKSTTPDLWRRNANVECMTYGQWVSYCDV